jgi:hypothetical protein
MWRFKMNSLAKKLGAVIGVILLVSSMVAYATSQGEAAVYFRNQNLYTPEAHFYIKMPDSREYVESPDWHSPDGSGANENLVIGSSICFAINTRLKDAHKQPLFKNYFLKVTRHGGVTYLDYYGFHNSPFEYGYNGPRRDEKDNGAGLEFIKVVTAQGICNVT